MIRGSHPDPSGKASRVVIYVSSDEGSPEVAARRCPNRARQSLPEDVQGFAASYMDDDDDVVVIEEFSPKLKSRKVKEGCNDDECLILDGDPSNPVPVFCEQCSDLQVVAEKGQVACRDYPHARFDCAKFPFDTTPHEKHCNLCHCYVCDSPAPCTNWSSGRLGHCNATDKEKRWRTCRILLKRPVKQEKSVPGASTAQMKGVNVPDMSFIVNEIASK